MTDLPARYLTTVRHLRQSPLRHAFTYRSDTWLVDLDHLPRKGFHAADHVGDPSLTLRQNVDGLLGYSPERVLLMASPRVLGHVFNPLSVFWALDAAGSVIATIAEVHNTYGGRHAYVLPPSVTNVDKAFYVSPFHEVEGHYELSLPLPSEELRLEITYHRPDGRPFVATVRGTRAPGRPHLLTTRLVAARIRLQGVRLFLRGLPVVPRTSKEKV